MTIKMDSMQKYATVDELEIPEGKVENLAKQWLVLEDGSLACKLQNEEINEHLNHNKIRNQIVRSDLMQAKYIQETEQQMYQKLRKQKQAQLDEQLAKELQLNLIEEEQKQMMEMQRIAEEDEKYAKNLYEKEKKKVQRRKFAREQAQIEKIKTERLQYYLDNNLDVTSTMNDDLDELDLSDFCMKPPDQLKGDELTIFMAEQDEELARFLQIYENQKKTNLIKDRQELIENQDYEIARAIYVEERAKLKRLKEKRLQKQKMKQRNQEPQLNQQRELDNEEEQTNQPEYYIPDNRLYRLPIKSNTSLNEDQLSYLNQNEKLYDEPPQENLKSPQIDYLNQFSCENSQLDNYNYNENYNEETNFKYPDDRPNSSNSSIRTQHYKLDHELENKSGRKSILENSKIDNHQLRYNLQSEDNAQYTLSTKQLSNQTNVLNLNFLNRALPPVPIDNIFNDIDPTYNKSKKSKNNSLSDNTVNLSSSNDSNNLQQISGLHFAHLARVEDDQQNNYDLVEQNCTTSIKDKEFDHSFNNQVTIAQNSGQNFNYVIYNQQLNQNYMPVQGQKRLPHISNQKKSKKDKNKDSKCRQQ